MALALIPLQDTGSLPRVVVEISTSYRTSHPVRRILASRALQLNSCLEHIRLCGKFLVEMVLAHCCVSETYHDRSGILNVSGPGWSGRPGGGTWWAREVFSEHESQDGG
jgi:hypothetical protein